MTCICRDESCAVPYGLCHCGCGQPAICTKTRPERGLVAGHPNKFINGHNKRVAGIVEQAVPFKIEGVYCRLIPLTQGMYAIVDEEDYWRLAKFKWCAIWNEETKTFYAMRGEGGLSVRMHNDIMHAPPGKRIDHRDPAKTFDNRRNNLRPANHRQNCQNRRKRSDNKSGYKGVSWDKRSGDWIVYICVNGKNVCLGHRNDPAEGHELYKEAAVKYHGEFARFE